MIQVYVDIKVRQGCICTAETVSALMQVVSFVCMGPVYE